MFYNVYLASDLYTIIQEVLREANYYWSLIECESEKLQSRVELCQERDVGGGVGLAWIAGTKVS